MKTNSSCVFCDIVQFGPYSLKWGEDVIAIDPLNPVTEGHRLVVPTAHVHDATTSPLVTAETMRCAAVLARTLGPCNIITSVGEEATQSIFHLHVHVVPRREGDGLMLPWST